MKTLADICVFIYHGLAVLWLLQIRLTTSARCMRLSWHCDRLSQVLLRFDCTKEGMEMAYRAELFANLAKHMREEHAL